MKLTISFNLSLFIMPIKYPLLLLLLFVVICTANNSCTKSPASSPIVPPPVDTTIHSTSIVNVYVAGTTIIRGINQAVYWKNGLMTNIPSGPYSFATCIYVYNNDVYTAVQGAGLDPFNYWKNTTGVVLPDTLGFGSVTTALTISKANIYATGTEHEYPYFGYGALYWKNNDYALHLVPPDPPTSHDSWGKAITVDNQDVYIAGYLDYKAVYWKNGNIIHLPVDTFLYTYSNANAICINNKDVYVAGTLNLNAQSNPQYESIATYWKNDKPFRLTRDTGSVANSITVVGNDIYVAGAIYSIADGFRAAYWKNGKLFILSSIYSVANAIAVNGTDVFIAGNINATHATYWKNGIPTSLGDGQANAIFITDK